MADTNTHISYSAEDIERYFKGSMSAKEMHEVEKAALQDPFLADAIEGYSRASFEQSKNHLNEITAALQTKKEETKIVSLPTKAFYWWRVAAIMILLVGTVTISWFIINSNNAKNEAIALAKEKENKSLSTDTVHQKETASAIVRNDTAEELFAQNLSTKRVKKEIRKREMEPAQDKIPSTAFSKMQTETTTRKIVADSAKIGNDVTAGITSPQVIAHDTLQFGKVVPEKVAVDSVYPARGWESFQAYVYKKLKNLADSSLAAEITGIVELEFSIDDEGEPYNFSIIKSVNDASASKAIEIVKEGPKWISTSKERKGKVTIKF